MNLTPDYLKMEPDYVKIRAIKPSLSGYIRRSQALLKISLVPEEKTIHDVRVLMKKSRAALKLTFNQLDKNDFDRNLFALREVGRIMCLWRETSVLIKILKRMKKECPDIFLKLKENEKITAFLKKDEPIGEPSGEMKAALERINELLHKTAYRIRFLSLSNTDPRLLIKELEITYSGVVNVYRSCRNKPRPEMIHEFRKRSKDFLYQLYFFRPLNPSVVKSVEKRIDIMAGNLGKFNDLSVLIKALGYNPEDSTNLPAMDELIIKIREKQDRYLARVWPVAHKIFCPGQELLNILGFRFLVVSQSAKTHQIV